MASKALLATSGSWVICGLARIASKVLPDDPAIRFLGLVVYLTICLLFITFCQRKGVFR